MPYLVYKQVAVHTPAILTRERPVGLVKLAFLLFLHHTSVIGKKAHIGVLYTTLEIVDEKDEQDGT